MYLLLVPPIAVALTLLVIGLSRWWTQRRAFADDVEAHRRCLEALDPRAPQRKAAQEAASAAPQATARIRRHA